MKFGMVGFDLWVGNALWMWCSPQHSVAI